MKKNTDSIAVYSRKSKFTGKCNPSHLVRKAFGGPFALRDRRLSRK